MATKSIKVKVVPKSSKEYKNSREKYVLTVKKKSQRKGKGNKYV